MISDAKKVREEVVLSSAFSIKISQFSSRKDEKQGLRTPREVRVSSKIIEKTYKQISRHQQLNKAHLPRERVISKCRAMKIDYLICPLNSLFLSVLFY